MLKILDPRHPLQPFPDVEEALESPNGLLAIGGCLSADRLSAAYRSGIFPWYGEDEPILWWSPNPRLVIYPNRFSPSRSLRKELARNTFNFTYDKCFDAVMTECAAPRTQQAPGTWITPAMKRAYVELHSRGLAHSIESWNDGVLAGGLYGVAIGQVFFGESMFYRMSNGSKAAFAYAVAQLKLWGYQLVDCQVHTDHLASLGGEEIARSDFVNLLKNYCDQPVSPLAWRNVEPNQ